jgi:hypothetical protein
MFLSREILPPFGFQVSDEICGELRGDLGDREGFALEPILEDS